MAARNNPLFRQHGLVRAASFATLLIVLVAPVAEARYYTNDANHYHLNVPDTWNETNGSGGVTFTGPMTGFVAAQIVIGIQADVNATNTEAWLGPQMTSNCDQVKAAFNGTYVVTPHTFTTTGGRLAGECVIDYNVFGIQFRDRIVVIVSDYWDTLYVVSMIDNKTAFPTRQSTWDDAANSFDVEGEPGTTCKRCGPDPLSGMTLYAVIAGVAAAVVVAAALVMRRKKRAGGVQPPAPGAPPGQVPPNP